MINVNGFYPKTDRNFTMNSVKFNRNLIHANVLCIKNYLDYVLAGIGNNLFIYEKTNLVLFQPIFKNERVHSIHIQDGLILLKGGRQLSLAKLSTSRGVKCEIISQIECSDWIQDIILLDNQLIGLVTAHNAFECWNLESKKQINCLFCEETCILYSCKVIGDCVGNVIIFAGTVFGNVIIWSPSLKENSILQTVKAHNGAVFSINVNLQEKLLTTTSDDRSFKVWSIISSNPITCPNDWNHIEIELVHTLYGHTARVWKSVILPTVYLTIGEDSQLIVWSKDGGMKKTLSLHQESGIRAVDYSPDKNTITTGGEDGGINMFSLNHLLLDIQAKMILDLGQSVSTKVLFTNTGLVYTLNGACVLVSGGGKDVLYESDRFSSYCIMEVSPGGEYICLGSITGDIVVINTERKCVSNEQLINGRVYSIHWLGAYILTCGPDGSLILWEFTNEVLQEVNTMSLPNCRERWTTSGAIDNDKLIVGDRMGNIHLYDAHNGQNPVKTFRKIHSYLGVTDIINIECVYLSVGRDGTIKEFTKDGTLSTTYKLPMEWPSKIVKYNNDTLILGFHSSSFIVWSMKARETIASHDCGGGHRSCDYKVHKNKLSFLYVKDKKVFVVILPLDEITRMRNGFHAKEINCLKILKNNPTIIITGSEDTTLRVSIINKFDVEQSQVLKTHISSVRALCACHTESQKVTFVSGGGKGQLVVWDLDLNTLKCQEIVNHRLRKEEQNWKNPVLSIDPETRIMCVDIFQIGSGSLFAVGCSDCHVRIFSYTEELKESCAISYTHCVLNVVFLNVNVLVSMGTDGKAVFWDISDCTDVSRLGSFSLHQSGINSFQFEEVDRGKYIFATGGDDNLISVALVEIDGKKIRLKRIWENRFAHSCQITGIRILKNLLVTTSIDQRITVWKWFFQNDEFKAEFLNQCMTAVPDIQGMDATWQNNSTILVTVHGKGMEALEIDVGPDNQHII